MNRYMARIILVIAVVAVAIIGPQPSVFAQSGTLVATVTFSVECASGLGVGLAFDGTNLWYSCYDTGRSPLDLHRADPSTGVVTASYDIVPSGGLGALAYDATRNVIWAGEGGTGPDGEPIYKLQLDRGMNVVSTTVAANVADPGFCDFGLDDGLAIDANSVADAADDVIYYSNDCFTQVIRAYRVAAFPAAVFSEPPFPWTGEACYNSGLAVGGQLLYQGSDGCSHVWVMDKMTKLPVYDFSTVILSDPNFRNEDLECDTNTFAAQGKHVLWSKEAYTPMRASAFEIEFGTCGTGGTPAEDERRMTGGGSVFTGAGARVTHGFELHCDTSPTNTLQINWGQNAFRLTQLNSAACSDDPAISGGNPAAGFDTFVGSGVGRLNGVDGVTIDFSMTDAGEPGIDRAEISIDGGSALIVAGPLDRGNHQALP